MKIHISYEESEKALKNAVMDSVLQVFKYPCSKVKRKPPKAGETRRHIYIETREKKPVKSDKI